MKTIYTKYNKHGYLELTDAVRFRPCTTIIGERWAYAGHRGNRIHSYVLPGEPGHERWAEIADDAIRYAFSEKHPTFRLWYYDWGNP
jgi:hypothetical protein